MTVPLRLAVCLFPGVTALDYQGPMELFNFISSKQLSGPIGGLFPNPPYSIDTTYLSHDLKPIEPFAGPWLLPSTTYGDTVGQYDIILVPGGMQQNTCSHCN
jgi:putative intracellular protease/amidase